MGQVQKRRRCGVFFSLTATLTEEEEGSESKRVHLKTGDDLTG